MRFLEGTLHSASIRKRILQQDIRSKTDGIHLYMYDFWLRWDSRVIARNYSKSLARAALRGWCRVGQRSLWLCLEAPEFKSGRRIVQQKIIFAGSFLPNPDIYWVQ